MKKKNTYHFYIIFLRFRHQYIINLRKGVPCIKCIQNDILIQMKKTINQLCFFHKHHILRGFVVVVGFKARLSHQGPRPIGGVPSLGVFLKDPSPYLREFRRKPRKTPNGQVDKLDRGFNRTISRSNLVQIYDVSIKCLPLVKRKMFLRCVKFNINFHK